MSEWWHEIDDAEDVFLSDDETALHISLGEDDFGTGYISIPVEFVRRALDAHDREGGSDG